MRINPIQIFNITKSQNFDKKSALKNTIQQGAFAMPTAAHYLSFMGGSSLNLKESIQNLDKLTNGSGKNFPPDIREAAIDATRSTNADNKTLINIHKEKYQALNACYDLDDVKKQFREFSDVKSDKDIDYLPDSFIGKVKRGEIDNFNKDEDLAFQLLKLYWAEGFSLNDLKEYAGVNLYHTLKKCNIPLMDRDYAHVLKFSDKEYNERLTKKMAQKRLESMDRRTQEKSGEPVYIPKGPLSDSHKKHISEGLIRHYSEHPEKLSQISQRQKEYFENNPEQKQLMQAVMLFAWKTSEGRSVQNGMKKFFKKHKIEFSDDFLNSDKAQQEALKDFWRINGWAKTQFSTAVTKGWQKARTNQAQQNQAIKIAGADFMDVTPKKYLEDVKKWCIKNNVPGFEPSILQRGELDTEKRMQADRFANLYNDAHPGIEDIVTSSLAAAMMSIKSDIIKNNVPKNISDKKDFLDAVVLNVNDLLYPNCPKNATNIPPQIVSHGEMTDLIRLICQIAQLHQQDNFISYISQKIDESYEILSNPDNKERFYKFVGY